jgi:MoaA/NifB/PqqE/SkfB family radical SAM enzyme
MCNRNIEGGLDNPLIQIQNWTLDDFKKIMTPSVLSQIRSYYFCSNFGDPMLNNNLIEMCRYSRKIAPNIHVSIHTNGGARSNTWWQQLARALPVDHNVVFALDGLSDTHHLYRVGTKFETVVEHARAFIAAGGTAEWVFIKFKHNEHQVDEARQMSVELGFKKFTLKNSSRFILEPKVKVVDSMSNIMHYIEPASDTSMKFIDKKIIDDYKEITKNSEIKCKVQEGKEIYIDAYKNVYPCCWIASVPYSYVPEDGAFEIRTEMLKKHHELMNRLGHTNAIDRSINDIIDSHEYQTVWNEFWTTNKLITCARTCGINEVKFAQPKDQIVS